MKNGLCSVRTKAFGGRGAALRLVAFLAPFFTLAVGSGWGAAKPEVVPKWTRFEATFQSQTNYAYPLQETSLTVTFTSPLGEKRQVPGFWDGGRTWRARFSPDQPGRWTFKTACSNKADQGLQARTGEFLCISALGESRFRRHGPVRLSYDHFRLEHADGTPFLYVADSPWNGARLSEPKDWMIYAEVRASQGFTVAQWSTLPGADLKNETALTGYADKIGVNPEFFRRLDAKVSSLQYSGILSAIAPIADFEGAADLSLPDDQAVLLVRYMVARWGADPVVWLIAFEPDKKGKKVERWKRIGMEVFGSQAHAPVILFPGRFQGAMETFRDQAWVDAFGFMPLADTKAGDLKVGFDGPLSKEWSAKPARPLIAFTPIENSVVPGSRLRFTADDIRRAAYWGLFLTRPAGFAYSGQAVAEWDTTVDPAMARTPAEGLPLWRVALFMPGAKQMGYLGTLINSTPYERLRPQPEAILSQPGTAAPNKWMLAQATPQKDTALVYVPENETVSLGLDALPVSPTVTWFNPRNGEDQAAAAVISGNSCQLPPPGPGDWALVVRSGK